MPEYLAGEFVGAFIGATLVWAAYSNHWRATEDPGLKLAVFCTAPAIRNTVANLITEIIGTFVLVFGVLAIFANEVDRGRRRRSAALLVGLLVLAIGLSLGGPTGYAINPARDLGPRIMHAILPIPGKGPSDWGYAWIPVVGTAHRRHPRRAGVRLRSTPAETETRRRTMAKYAAAIDQGTTSTRCMVFDHGGQVVSVAQKEHEQIYPEAGLGRARRDGDLGAHARRSSTRRSPPPGASADDIAAVGITNQRETTVVWDRNTGEPIHNAIVWQDTRTDKLVDEFSKDGGQAPVRGAGRPAAGDLLLGAEGPLDARQRRRRRAIARSPAICCSATWTPGCIWNLTGGTDGGLHITDVRRTPAARC